MLIASHELKKQIVTKKPTEMLRDDPDILQISRKKVLQPSLTWFHTAFHHTNHIGYCF